MTDQQLKEFEKAVRNNFGDNREAMNAAHFGLIYQEWISCYERQPEHKQQIIFRTDHEGVWCGRYLESHDTQNTIVGTYYALTDGMITIGWNHRLNPAHSEVHEWMPLPEK